jgi:predicted Zn-dependent protease
VKYFFHKVVLFFTIFTLLQATCVSKSSAFTVGEEREMGEQLLYQIRLAFPLLDDPDITQYINALGADVLEVAGFQYFDYRFNIIRSSQFNAFAAPSGLIFFYTGLIEQMHHEDELVSVLAHEIGHVVSRHIAKGMDKNMKLSVATSLLALASIALGAGALSQALLTGSLAAGQAASLHFSRQAEEEADLLAYGWMKEMKRHPRGQEAMLRAMRRISRYSMGDNVPQYLLTHPDPAHRLDYVQALVAYENDQLVDFGFTDDFEFLRMRYRMLSLVKDGKQLRNLLMSRLSNTALSDSERVMLEYGLSQLDRRENNFSSSRKLLTKVIQFYPERSILQVDLGLVEMQDGHKDRALALIQSAYERNRHDHWAIFQLARVWLSLGNLPKAEEFFNELQAVTPAYSKIYYELGKLKAEQGRSNESSYFLGKFYLYEGKLRLARESLKKAQRKKVLSKKYQDDIDRMLGLMDRLEKEK